MTSEHVHVWALDDQGFGSCRGCDATRQFQNALAWDPSIRWNHMGYENTLPVRAGREYDREEDA